MLKTLDALSKSELQVLTRNAELATKDGIIKNQDIYTSELLKAVSLLTSSEKRDKSFFRKVLDQLGKILKTATNPAHLATIATLIVLIKNLK